MRRGQEGFQIFPRAHRCHVVSVTRTALRQRGFQQGAPVHRFLRWRHSRIVNGLLTRKVLLVRRVANIKRINFRSNSGLFQVSLRVTNASTVRYVRSQRTVTPQ